MPVCFCCYGRGVVTELVPLVVRVWSKDEDDCVVFRRIARDCPRCTRTDEEIEAATRDTVPPPRESGVRLR